MSAVMTKPEAPEREQRFLLRNLDWPTYQAIARALDGHRVRLTYDQGKLEFMTISHVHERFGSLLGQFMHVLTDELDLPRQSGGSTTFGREDLDRALEPDKCFYLTNEPKVRGKDEIDLGSDPPPDLAVEVDLSRSSLNRLGIYAVMGVPEVWRYDGETLSVLQLQHNGQYVAMPRSQFFPMTSMEPLAQFLQRRTEMSETQLMRAFRHWVRERIASGWA